MQSAALSQWNLEGFDSTLRKGTPNPKIKEQFWFEQASCLQRAIALSGLRLAAFPSPNPSRYDYF
jgi:hypothetical protein